MNQKKAEHYLAYSLFTLFGILFLPFWKPIIMAGIFALFWQPLLARSHKVTNLSQKLVISAVALTTLLLTSPFIIGIYYTSTEILDFAKKNHKVESSNLSVSLSNKLIIASEKIGIPQNIKINQFIEKTSLTIGTKAIDVSTSFLSEIPEIVLSLLIFTLMLYVLLKYQGYLKERILKWKIISKIDLNNLLKILQKSTNQCFSSLFIVGLVQSSLIVIASLIAGFSRPFMIFFATFICSLVPLIGTAPIALILAMWQFTEGDVGMGILIVVFGFIAGTIDNVIKPMLVKNGMDMDGSITLISIIGAITIFGLLGLFLGPILAITTAYYFHKDEPT